MERQESLCKGQISPIWWGTSLIKSPLPEHGWWYDDSNRMITSDTPVYYLKGEYVTLNGVGIDLQLNIYPS